ncbi:MAG: 6-phosphogluconate dehydrogenase [Bacteroidetes bacterium]|nr:MAG: 6-phosphogluconate dehydrogenase [Bacteroidota bacterium]PTM14819.1 MAG: 6-phosphogluconate dehydrogenase [Bacteroidota bacterium]
MSEFQQVVKEGAQSVGRKLKRLLLWLFGVAIVAGLLFIWVCGWTYSDGTRAGELIKVSTKGVVFKTYEGQLNLGGFSSSDSGVVGNTWDFSTTKKAVYQRLQELEGHKVKLTYRQRYKPLPWQGKTEYFIDEVKVLD